MSAGLLEVVNWSRFQHYKDRNPPWIKLHTSLLESYDFQQLSDFDQLLLMKLWLLAARTDNRIPNDPAFVQGRLGLRAPPDFGKLIDAGFLSRVEQGASNPLALEREERKAEQSQSKKSGEDWLASDDGVKRRGKWLGLESRVGESMYDYTQRVIAANHKRAQARRG